MLPPFLWSMPEACATTPEFQVLLKVWAKNSILGRRLVESQGSELLCNKSPPEMNKTSSEDCSCI